MNELKSYLAVNCSGLEPEWHKNYRHNKVAASNYSTLDRKVSLASKQMSSLGQLQVGDYLV